MPRSTRSPSAYADKTSLRETVAKEVARVGELDREVASLRAAEEERARRLDFLQYQRQELEEKTWTRRASRVSKPSTGGSPTRRARGGDGHGQPRARRGGRRRLPPKARSRRRGASWRRRSAWIRPSKASRISWRTSRRSCATSRSGSRTISASSRSTRRVSPRSNLGSRASRRCAGNTVGPSRTCSPAVTRSSGSSRPSRAPTIGSASSRNGVARRSPRKTRRPTSSLGPQARGEEARPVGRGRARGSRDGGSPLRRRARAGRPVERRDRPRDGTRRP